MSMRLIWIAVAVLVLPAAADYAEFPKNISAKERTAMAAAKKKSVVTAKKIAEIKKQHAALLKTASDQLAKADKLRKEASGIMEKMPRCARKIVDVDVKKADLDKNTAKAKALAVKEAAKRSKKEKALVSAHGRAQADKASKALIMEEHDALHGKLMKVVLAIAKAEAKAAAPKAARAEVVVYHKKIAAEVKAEVAALVLKDATETARGLAMKEVESQMGKSKKVKALVASVAKDAAKYFAHKFSQKMLTKLCDDEAHKQAGASAGRHADAVIGKVEDSLKKKMRSNKPAAPPVCHVKLVKPKKLKLSGKPAPLSEE